MGCRLLYAFLMIRQIIIVIPSAIDMASHIWLFPKRTGVKKITSTFTIIPRLTAIISAFLVCKNNLLAHQTGMADHIICRVGDARYANSSMPEGNYAVACGHGSFQDTSPIYERLLDYIHENQLEITGHAYETRLIDETASKNPDLHVIQVCIHVK